MHVQSQWADGCARVHEFIIQRYSCERVSFHAEPNRSVEAPVGVGHEVAEQRAVGAWQDVFERGGNFK